MRSESKNLGGKFNLNQILLGKIESALEKLNFSVLEIEHLSEILHHRFLVHVVLAGVSVDAYKLLLGEGMNADVGFGDHDKSGIASAVFNVPWFSVFDHRLRQLFSPYL